MKVRKYILLFSFLFAISFNVKNVIAEENNSSGNIYKQMTALKCDSLVKANETNPNFVILDVRSLTEWTGYHLNGSINHSTGNATFDAELAALPKHKLYLLHCQSGSRSAGAFEKMKKLGFAEVYEMIGGISAWRNAGLPTTTLSSPKLMVVSAIKKSNSAGNDSTQVTVTNRANGVLSFSNYTFTDEHVVKSDFNILKTIEGAQDYSFFVVHPAGLGDTTLVALSSNGGNVSLAIGNSLSVYAGSNPTPELRLYPNPVTDRIIIDTSNEWIEEITITDLTGKLLVNLKSSEISKRIDVSEFREGIYLARVKIRDEIITRKFVVKR
jgi:rhodanese-related sulfurtransferase